MKKAIVAAIAVAFTDGKTARVMSGTQTEARRRLSTVIAR